jgi:hypothetical protein
MIFVSPQNSLLDSLDQFSHQRIMFSFIIFHFSVAGPEPLQTPSLVTRKHNLMYIDLGPFGLGCLAEEQRGSVAVGPWWDPAQSPVGQGNTGLGASAGPGHTGPLWRSADRGRLVSGRASCLGLQSAVDWRRHGGLS